ncbi:MAG: helix-turn-helix domain-containing protein, partial [Chloroflexota bacterium]
MRLEVTTRVWREARVEGSALLVLLALAESADAEGRCGPPVHAIAGRVGLHPRQVQRILRQLVQEGEVDVVPGGSRGVPNQYRL